MVESSVPTTPGSGAFLQDYSSTRAGELRRALASVLVDQFQEPISSTMLRSLIVAQPYTIRSDSVADGWDNSWTQTVANGGTLTSSIGEGLVQSSANAAGSAQISSPIVLYYPGQTAWFNSAIRLGDTGSAGNVRRWGAFTVSGTTPQDGFAYELNGTTLNAVVYRNGTGTAVASTAWSEVVNAPFTLDLNYTQFEIRWTSNSVQFWINNVLRHTVSGGATTLTGTLNFPKTMQSINSSGATNRLLAVRNIGLGRFGTPPPENAGTPVTIVFNANASATADTLLSVVKVTGGVAAAAATTVPVTPGKILRLLSLSLSVTATANTAVGGAVNLRMNPTGAAVIGSPLIARLPVGLTAATTNSTVGDTQNYGLGIDLSGLNQLGISATATATSANLNIVLTAEEH